MAKQPIKQRGHTWAVYHIKGAPAKFIRIVYDAPDGQTGHAAKRGEWAASVGPWPAFGAGG
jgi:hypothetical protein